MRASKEAVSRVEIADSVSNEVQNLRMVFCFLSDVADTAMADGVQFVGKWHVQYLEAALVTLGNSIENIETAIHLEKKA